MPEVSSYQPGTPSWIDLATTDLAAAKSFYTGLFGWSVVEVPSSEGAYCMLYKGELAVAACYQMTPEMIDNGIPPHWASYVTVGRLEDTVDAALAAGGTVVQEPHDIPGSGRTAAIQDPSAAVFALWEPEGHIGAQLVNEPGSLVWNELQTYETAPAQDFYTSVFGWSAVTSTMPTGAYTSFLLDDHPVAGMMAIQPEWGPVPPNWSIYLGVASMDDTCEYVASNGGKVEMPPMHVPDVGTFALFQDPQGAFFYGLQNT